MPETTPTNAPTTPPTPKPCAACGGDGVRCCEFGADRD